MGLKESKIIEENVDIESYPRFSKPELKVFDDSDSMVDLINYGNFLPTNAFHQIFLFLDTKDLAKIFLVCKLFNRISNTNYFWKSYVHQIIKKVNVTKFEEFLSLQHQQQQESKSRNYKLVYFDFFFPTYKFKDPEFKRIFERTPQKLFKDSYNIIKILLLGDSGVGKTSYSRRFHDGIFQKIMFLSKIGVDFKFKTVFFKNKLYKLQVWDTAGQERFRTITRSYYRGAHCVLLCFAIDDRRSFNNLKYWYGELVSYQKENDPGGGGDGKLNHQIVVCGMKMDLESKRIVTKQMIFEMMRDLRLPLRDYCECSSKDDIFTYFPIGRLVEKHRDELEREEKEELEDDYTESLGKSKKKKKK